MILFWILWGIDALVALVLLIFFVVGLSDGTVSGNNLGSWLLIIGVLVFGFLFGSIQLRVNNHEVIAKVLLGLLAIPSVLFVLFYTILILTGARWN